MPELPEVETIVRELHTALSGGIVREVWLNPSLLKPVVAVDVNGKKVIDTKLFVALLQGRTVKGVERRGKLIIVTLDNSHYVLIHLKMTGQLVLNESEARKHTHVIIRFTNKPELHFNDVRRFGFWVITDKNGLRQTVENRFRFGPEPLSADFTFEYFRNRLLARKGAIKSVLLDQGVVAGLGNIYVDETLFRAEIHPQRRAQTLSEAEVRRVFDSARAVLKAAVRAGGSSSKNYVRSTGKQGSFQKKHQVYRRTGQPCVSCGEPIERVVIGGRSSHYCRVCQK